MKPDRAGQTIVQRLDDAIAQLHQDVHRVEVWAGALSGFAQPVPGYQPSDDLLLPRDGSDKPNEPFESGDKAVATE